MESLLCFLFHKVTSTIKYYKKVRTYSFLKKTKQKRAVFPEYLVAYASAES